MSNNSCYECQNRHPGCHSKCEIYKDFKNELKRVKANRNRDLVYKNYKSEKTIRISKKARPHEHRGFSSI